MPSRAGPTWSRRRHRGRFAAAVLVEAAVACAAAAGRSRGADLYQRETRPRRSRACAARRSDLRGTHLSHARDLTQAQIEGAHGDRRTPPPAKQVVSKHWLKDEDGGHRSWSGAPARPRPPPWPTPTPSSASSAEPRSGRFALPAERLVKDLHPDGRSDDPVAGERLKAINRAYQDLKDLERRAESNGR